MAASGIYNGALYYCPIPLPMSLFYIWCRVARYVESRTDRLTFGPTYLQGITDVHSKFFNRNLWEITLALICKVMFFLYSSSIFKGGKKG